MQTTTDTLPAVGPPRVDLRPIVAQAAAAATVGLVASFGGAFVGGLLTSVSARDESWYDPRRLAPPLLVAAVAVAVAATRGRRSAARGWVLATLGALLATGPLLLVRWADGTIQAVTVVEQPTLRTVAVSLAVVAGLGLAVGGVLSAAPAVPLPPAGAPVAAHTAAAVLRLAVPAGFAVGFVVRANIHEWWQIRFGVLAFAASALAAVLTHRYDRGQLAAPDRSASRADPVVVCLVLLGALVVGTLADDRYAGAIGTLMSSVPDLSAGRLGLAVQVLTGVAVAAALAGYVARRRGAAAVRRICVLFGTGVALGVRGAGAAEFRTRVVLTTAVVAGMATAALIAARYRRGRPAVPWDLIGLALVALGAVLTVSGGGAGHGAPPGMAMITAGTVVAWVAVAHDAATARAGGSVLIGVAIVLVGARLAFGASGMLLWWPKAGLDVPPVPPGYRDQLWALVWVPLALAVLVAGAAWFAGSRAVTPEDSPRVPDSAG